MRIPKIIHQIWFQGADHIPANFRKNSDKLQVMNGKWHYMLWDDCTLRRECQSISRSVVAKYDSFKHMHQKIDFGRYVVLYRYGGVSIDMDVKPLRPLDSIPSLANSHFIACAAPLNRFELTMYSGGYFDTIVNNAMILTTPGSVFLSELISAIVSARTRAWGKMYQIQWTTGPFIFTQSLRQSIGRHGDEGVTILPSWVFEPCYSHDPNCKVDGRAILDHQHATSWVSGGLINVSTIYFTVKPAIPWILFFVLLCLTFWYRRALGLVPSGEWRPRFAQ